MVNYTIPLAITVQEARILVSMLSLLLLHCHSESYMHFSLTWLCISASLLPALLSIDWLVVVVVIVLIVSPSLSHGLVIIFTVVFLCPRPHPHHCVWESLATIFKPEHECLRVLISLNLKQEPCLDLCASGGKDGVTLLWDLAQGKRLYSLDVGSIIHALKICEPTHREDKQKSV
ncbi:hypothetical protein AAZX31_10G120200 [Glycine max]